MSSVNLQKAKSITINSDKFINAGLLNISALYRKYINEVVIPYGMIVDRIEAQAKQILEEYQGKDIVFLVMLKGAITYANYLMKFIYEISDRIEYKGRISFEYISSSSYSHDKSTGQLKVSKSDDVLEKLKEKNLIIVEDTYDSGFSLNCFIADYLISLGLSSLKTCVLFYKSNKENFKYDLQIDYIGFSLPGDAFIIGFGLDYQEKFRDLKHLCVISDQGLKSLKNE